MRGIPNAITLLRLLLTPVIAMLLVERYYVAGFVIYVFAALSDGLDGYLARRFNVTSRVGALLDPVADKLIVICASFALAWQGLLPLWVAIPLIARANGGRSIGHALTSVSQATLRHFVRTRY